MKLDTLIVCGAGIYSGKEVMSLELALGLANRGSTVSFVTSCWNNGDFVNRLKPSGLLAYSLPIGFISATLTRKCLLMTAEQMWRWPELAWRYSRLLLRYRPTRVVHTNWHHLLLLLPFLRPQRDLFWLHEFIPDLPHYRRVFGWFARRVGCIVCVSHAVAGSLRQIGIADDKILVIHNGLTDPTRGVEFPLSCCGRVRVGIVGQIGAWKGHDDLFEAFALVSVRYPAAELHVFGQGDPGYREELEQKAVDLGIAERIEWHDFVADRERIYGELDICVVPSRSQDPFPTTALEAGFFGLPTIVTRRGGLPEIIEHEVNGLLVEPERPAEIAEALCRLIDQPALRQYLAVNARQRAVDCFGTQRFLEAFQGLLNS
jgi:glycosyltransferase involved in cell wall biosynthesis